MKKKGNTSMKSQASEQPANQEEIVQYGERQEQREDEISDAGQEDSTVDENPEAEDSILDEDSEAEDSILDGNPEDEDTSGADQEPEELPKVLTAVYPILYLSHQYKVGDILPANDVGMVEAWLCAGTAVWMKPAGEKPKAKVKTAEPGLSGQAATSETEDGDDLVGKIPKTYGRKRRV